MENSELLVDTEALSTRNHRIYDWVMYRIKWIHIDPLYLLVHGPAGSGKSLLLKAIRNGVRELFDSEKSCIVAAPTAIGASLLDAHTIHSLFITWTPSNVGNFLESAKDNQMEHMKWMITSKVILIDIINFVGAFILAAIDHRLRQITGVAKPFGGLSVIVFGDFQQLPPVDGPWVFKGLTDGYLQKFRRECPESPDNLWSLFKIVEVTENQRTIGHGIEEFDKKFDRSREEIVNDYIELCKANPDLTFAILAKSRDIVKELNDAIVEKTEGFREYPPGSPIGRPFPKNGAVTDKYLKVSEGCPVIMTCNINFNNFSLKNGTQGVVVNLHDNAIIVNFPSATFSLKREDWIYQGARWSQFPIRVAHAHTIERSQGMEFDGVIVVRNKYWDREGHPIRVENHGDEPGELYTALSRARNLELCYVTPREPSFVVSTENFEETRREIERMREHCSVQL
uniref:ATP-dependent DNA helicase n=1 Tax=Caenorhabditis tropicalis TaxID=1561998 RepID=A0A1I7SZD8_9PELO